MERVEEHMCMRIGRKAGVILCGILCLATLLCGCGQVKVPEDLLVPAISVTGKGEVTAYIVESFDKDYYDLEELRTIVEEELQDFNEGFVAEAEAGEGTAAAEMVSLKVYAPEEISLLGDEAVTSEEALPKVVLVLKFRDTAAYEAYTGTDLFYGTVAQANKAGYDLAVELKSVKDGAVIGKSRIYEKGKSHLLIVGDNIRIYGPGKAQYITAGAAVNEDGSVEPSDTDDNTYIIMK